MYLGRHILTAFISGDPSQTEQVLGIAWHYLSIMASVLCILYFLHVYRSALQGLGNTIIPMVSGIIEFFVRVGVAFVSSECLWDRMEFFMLRLRHGRELLSYWLQVIMLILKSIEIANGEIHICNIISQRKNAQGFLIDFRCP